MRWLMDFKQKSGLTLPSVLLQLLLSGSTNISFDSSATWESICALETKEEKLRLESCR